MRKFNKIPEDLALESKNNPFWNEFNKICQIPHKSGNERELRDYIVSLCEGEGLSYSIDEVGNLLVLIESNNGSNKSLCLQTHLDMVCQKNKDTKFDFSKDSLKLIRNGDILKADGTTLGADNGIGVSYCISIIKNNKTIKHPNLELLFTVDEEVGMGGIIGFKENVLKSDYMINLDTEEESEIVIGCAGGLNIDAKKKLNFIEKTTKNTFKIEIKGLKGGHSGLQILNSSIGNSIKILGSLLKKINENSNLELIDIRGGSARNAIPRDAFSVIGIDLNYETVLEIVNKFQLKYSVEYPFLKINVELIEFDNEIKIIEKSKEIIDFICSIHSGVFQMSEDVFGQVKTSNNFGIIKIEDKTCMVNCMPRSFSDLSLDMVIENVTTIMRKYGFEPSLNHRYSGWKPEKTSFILEYVKSKYKDYFNRNPKIIAVHAGLELGILKPKYPKLDMISIGPNIKYPHSPREQVSIKSANKVWSFLISILEDL